MNILEEFFQKLDNSQYDAINKFDIEKRLEAIRERNSVWELEEKLRESEEGLDTIFDQSNSDRSKFIDSEFMQQYKMFVESFYTAGDIENKNPIEVIQTLSLSPPILNYKLIEEESSNYSFQEELLFLSQWETFTEEEQQQFPFWQIYDLLFHTSNGYLIPYFYNVYKEGKINYETTINFLKNSWLDEPLAFHHHKGRILRPIDILIPPIRLFFSELKVSGELRRDYSHHSKHYMSNLLNWLDKIIDKIDKNLENYLLKSITDKDRNDSHEILSIVLTETLILKVETLLRYLCERVDFAIFGSCERRLIAEKNFDDILAYLKNCPEVQTNFDENDRLFIKFILSEEAKTGNNLRNKINHGLMYFGEYGSFDAITIFVIILRLCKYHPPPLPSHSDPFEEDLPL